MQNLYNGSVEAILTVLGALAALLAGRSSSKVSKTALSALPALAALGQAGGVVASTLATELWVSYLGYIVLGIIYHYMITLTR